MVYFLVQQSYEVASGFGPILDEETVGQRD